MENKFHIYDFDKKEWVAGYDHIHELIDWVIQEVLSAGGDGDCTVITHYYSAYELAMLYVEKFNKLIPTAKCEIVHNKSLQWNQSDEDFYICTELRSQESAIFTDYEDYIPMTPQCVIKI